jgi:hypothetical protein
VRRYERNAALDEQQLTGRHLRRTYRVLHGADDVVRDFNKLADESRIHAGGGYMTAFFAVALLRFAAQARLHAVIGREEPPGEGK